MAENVNINRTGPYDMLDNMPGSGLADYHDATREYKPTYPRPDWRVEVGRAAAALAGVFLLWLLFAIWKAVYCWNAANWLRCDVVNAVEPIAVGLLLLSAGALVTASAATHIAIAWRLATAWAARVATTFNRWSNPVRTDLMTAPEYAPGRYAVDVALKRETAPYETLHSINTYSPSFQQPKAPEALPAPSPDVALVPPDAWLPWLLEQHHAMIAGATGSGKTTFARIAFGERLRAGYAGVVIDPKGKDWYGLPVVGGGRRFGDILAALDQIRCEMDARFVAYGAGEREFAPLCVLVDEVPDIMDACLDDRRRLVDGRWARFVRQLGSLAREVRISVTMLTQSPLVEDLGMNSAMRKNFTRIALGDEAPLLIREERDPKRRAQLQDLLRGQTHPAALYRRGEVHLLDTSTVPDLADRPVRGAEGWLLAAPKAEPTLAQKAAALVALHKGDRTAAARSLLAQRGTQVRGGWRYEVKEIARALGLRDEEVTKIGRPR